MRWWMWLAIILLVITIALPTTESAGNQDSPAVAAARRLIGDYRIIPAERIGTIGLGETTRDDFRRHFWLTNLYGYRQGPDVQWNWPERNLASGPGGPWDFPYMFVFCRSNNRLMATSDRHVPRRRHRLSLGTTCCWSPSILNRAIRPRSKRAWAEWAQQTSLAQFWRVPPSRP